MLKVYLFVIVATAATAIYALLPSYVELVSHSVHWVGIVVGAHHIFDELCHIRKVKGQTHIG